MHTHTRFGIWCNNRGRFLLVDSSRMAVRLNFSTHVKAMNHILARQQANLEVRAFKAAPHEWAWTNQDR